MFNPESFLNETFEDSNSTSYEPVPVGEYQACVYKVDAKVTNSGRALLEVHWEIDAPGNELADEKKVRQTVWLDVNENGALDMGRGKNVQLGRLREALGQNKPGQSWAPGHMEGQVATVSVNHDVQGEAIYARVNAVTAL